MSGESRVDSTDKLVYILSFTPHLSVVHVDQPYIISFQRFPSAYKLKICQCVGLLILVALAFDLWLMKTSLNQ